MNETAHTISLISPLKSSSSFNTSNSDLTSFILNQGETRFASGMERDSSDLSPSRFDIKKFSNLSPVILGVANGKCETLRDRETSGLRPKAALSNSSLVQCEWGLIILVSLLLSPSFDKEVKALIEKDIVQTGRNQKNPILQWSFFLISLQFLLNGRFYTRGRIIRREGSFVCTTK